MSYHHKKGFVALIASIIVSFLALACAVTAGDAVFRHEISLQRSEYKLESYALVLTCLHRALFNLAIDPDYVPSAGGETVTVDKNNCIILNVQKISSSATSSDVKIEVTASRGDVFTNLQGNATIKQTDIILNGYEEVSNFSLII